MNKKLNIKKEDVPGIIEQFFKENPEYTLKRFRPDSFLKSICMFYNNGKEARVDIFYAKDGITPCTMEPNKEGGKPLVEYFEKINKER